MTFLSIAAFAVASVTTGEPPVDFNKQIRPILSDRCFRCHGFDEAKREAGLRLDLRADAIADHDGTHAIVPGKPDVSEMVRRITSRDKSEKMPPPASNKKLSADEIALLTRWIAEGAKYEDHWAFQPVKRPPIPKVDGGATLHPIDGFILAQLAARKIKPSPLANRRVLIRRLYQDLVGLLPTPEEVDAFVTDQRPDAYERLVDSLLASPHYGERWGRHWLDQARYADSHGFTIDGARIMWPYRDWVIWAHNTDLPFDRFTIDQLAGDLLPNPTKQQLVATAFHRNTAINQEGGVKADQYRHEAIVDRVATTSAVWLGATVACAQCHTHKFDPISHADYYRMYAFFAGDEDSNNAGPTVEVHEGEVFGFTGAQKAAAHSLDEKRKELARISKKSSIGKDGVPAFAKSKWTPAPIADFRTGSNAGFQRLPDGSLLSDGKATENDAFYITFGPRQGPIAAVRLRVLPHDSLPSKGPGLAKNGNFVLTDIELQVGDQPIRFSSAWADHEQDDYGVAGAIDDDKMSGWAINAGPGSPRKMNAAHEAVFLLATPQNIQEPLTLVMRHDRNRGYMVGRFAIDFTDKAAVDMSTAKAKAPTVEALKAEIAKLETQLPGKGKKVDQMVLRRQRSPAPTYLMTRGDFLRPDKSVGALEPGVPAAFDPAARGRKLSSRVDLANWLVDKSNPLTPRVFVNRVWMHYFGRGLVETENDFGYQGTPPTHPELLDWLASEFVANGWSMKRLHRMIVMSQAYQRASDHRTDLAEIDPDNRLLSRQTRFRVEGEIVRDQALAASGLLAPKLGGPSVYPPIADGVFSFTQSTKNWPESQGPDRYRRTLYTMFYRSAPHPLFTTFDAPDFNTSCTCRAKSNTPLQALTLANDKIFTELADGLAARAIREVGASANVEKAIDRLFQLTLCRLPENKELALLVKFHARQAARENKATNGATGDGKDDSLAAVARVLLNSDEFVTRN